MTKYVKLLLAYSRLLGEFRGLIQGITYWDLPKELKSKINTKIEELDKTDTEQYSNILEKSSEELLLQFGKHMRKNYRINVSNEEVRRDIEEFKSGLEQ